MDFENYTGPIRPHWCQHIDLIGKQELTQWFKTQESYLDDRWEQAHGWDGTPEDVLEVKRDRAQLQEWKKEFIRLGFIFK